MKNYTTLIFDAFDTVVHINRAQLPIYQVNGQTVHTTARAVHSTYERHFGNIEFDAFYRAFIDSYEEVEQAREAELKEIASQERFRTMLRLLGQDAGNADRRVLDELTLSHMDQLQQVFEVRPETLGFLEWAASRFRRAMISNFDYAPALYAVLERYAIRSAFETITVSVEVGWRKPHPIIFERTFSQMKIQPWEALYIGDQLFLDVFGSLRVGMDVVWLQTGREAWTPDYPEPTFKVRSIGEIVEILEKKS